ncbi:hypothetical protein C8Q73DRAFT_198729 [Cubamyces lactineus]|nr:hypothetical protein C8Q73DRAFT_198729 [Cubamyces lactineus]
MARPRGRARSVVVFVLASAGPLATLRAARIPLTLIGYFRVPDFVYFVNTSLTLASNRIDVLVGAPSVARTALRPISGGKSPREHAVGSPMDVTLARDWFLARRERTSCLIEGHGAEVFRTRAGEDPRPGCPPACG